MSFYIPSFGYSTGMKNPVRRCLFERPTAEKQEKDFQHQESKLLEDEKAKCFREKWGLDPKTGSIVSDAEYECVPVDTNNESIPSFYTKGYPVRKPRPVQSLHRERSHIGLYVLPTRLNFDCPPSPRPLKRRCPVDNEDDHDENTETVFNDISGNKRVPGDGDLVVTSSASSGDNRSSSNSFSSSSSSVDSDSPISMPTTASFQRSMSDISSRSTTDLCTPQQRPRSLTQKTMKDFMPCKKPRCSTKTLPRT